MRSLGLFGFSERDFPWDLNQKVFNGRQTISKEEAVAAARIARWNVATFATNRCISIRDTGTKSNPLSSSIICKVMGRGVVAAQADIYVLSNDGCGQVVGLILTGLLEDNLFRVIVAQHCCDWSITLTMAHAKWRFDSSWSEVGERGKLFIVVKDMASQEKFHVITHSQVRPSLSLHCSVSDRPWLEAPLDLLESEVNRGTIYCDKIGLEKRVIFIH